MKIHSLHIRNLNSLVGDWAIDFSDPAFEETGFFAITGPTGAGKSTILDAICLALYGSTPRLGRISQSSNAIMSTSAGDCLAEVVFSTEKGRFRSTWRQKRAYGKPDRDLQTPSRELAYADTNILIETKTKIIENLIEEYTGMDLDRFTRTMMLAQGSFTAFLLAPVKERSNILEEITGTEVYSALSKMVFERSKLEDAKLTALQEELEAMKCLSPEEIASVREEISVHTRNIEQNETDIRTIETRIQWLTTIQALDQDLQRAEESLHRSRREYEAFGDDRERLACAKRALLIEGPHTLLQTHRQEKEYLLKQICEEEQRIPVLREMYDQALLREEDARKKLDTSRLTREQDEKIARDVRILISRIQTKEEECREKRNVVEDQNRGIQSLRLVIQQLEEEYNKVLEKVGNAEAYLKAHQQDSGLAEELTVAENLYADYLKFSNQLRENGRILSDLEEKEKNATDGIEGYQEQIISLEEEMSVLSRQIDEFDGKIRDLLDRTTPEDLNNSINSLTLRIKDLVYLHKLAVSLQEKQQVHADKDVIVHQNTEAIHQAEIERSPFLEKELRLSEEISSLEGEYLFARQVLSTEDIRSRLEDGKPCPVCGAVHHPYAEGHIPEIGRVESVLAERRSELAEVRQKITGCTHRITSLVSQNATLIKENEERGAEIDRDLLAIHEAASMLSLLPGDQDWKATIHDAFLLADQERERRIAIQKQVLLLIGDLEKARKSREKNLDQTASVKEKLALFRQEQVAIHRDLENCSITNRNISRDLEEKKAELNRIFLRYGFSNDHAFDTVLHELSERKTFYTSNQSSLVQLSPLISSLKADIRNSTGRLEERETDLQRLQEEFSLASRDLQALIERRLALYGDKDPDKEEERLKRIESDHDKCHTEMRIQREEKWEAFKNIEGKILHLDVSLKSVLKKIDNFSEGFHTTLAKHGFSSEDEFISVLLPASAIADLEATEKHLDSNLISSGAMVEEKRRELARQKELNLTTEPMEALTIRVEQRKETIQVLQNHVFAKRQFLLGNSRQEEEAERLRERIADQVKEQVRWGRLNRLIGSSDGTKFRSFAQGLTLSVLLNYANIHLQKLTDRYFLTTKKDSPLEIHVIDNYRAGEVRVAQNLSGGESFIVSLALALGLSAMSSRNVRVDSLFLDEGFGTLDDDSLEMALSTLAGMKQEGKLIGVISHVQTLKERIPVQIVVEKMSGGKSRLSGPGCRRW